MNPAVALLISISSALLGLITVTVVTWIVLRQKETELKDAIAQQTQSRATLEQFHSDLTASPGMRLTWKTPLTARPQENAAALELTGAVEVETIDHDGNTQTRYSLNNGHAVVPVSMGMHTAVALDGIDTLDVYIIEGRVNSVNLTLTSGLTLGTANLSA